MLRGFGIELKDFFTGEIFFSLLRMDRQRKKSGNKFTDFFFPCPIFFLAVSGRKATGKVIFLEGKLLMKEAFTPLRAWENVGFYLISKRVRSELRGEGKKGRLRK